MCKFISGYFLVGLVCLSATTGLAQDKRVPGVQKTDDTKNQPKPDQVSRIETILKSHKDPKVRSAAAFALGQLGTRAGHTLESLILACGDDSEDVRVEAKKAIALIASGKPASDNEGGGVAPVKGKYTIKLVSDPQGKLPGGFHSKKISFKSGTVLTVKANSTSETNINLYVDDPATKQIASDVTKGKNCSVQVSIEQDGLYSIVVDNLGPKDTECTITYSAK